MQKELGGSKEELLLLHTTRRPCAAEAIAQVVRAIQQIPAFSLLHSSPHLNPPKSLKIAQNRSKLHEIIVSTNGVRERSRFLAQLEFERFPHAFQLHLRGYSSRPQDVEEKTKKNSKLVSKPQFKKLESGRFDHPS